MLLSIKFKNNYTYPNSKIFWDNNSYGLIYFGLWKSEEILCVRVKIANCQKCIKIVNVILCQNNHNFHNFIHIILKQF